MDRRDSSGSRKGEGSSARLRPVGHAVNSSGNIPAGVAIRQRCGRSAPHASAARATDASHASRSEDPDVVISSRARPGNPDVCDGLWGRLLTVTCTVAGATGRPACSRIAGSGHHSCRCGIPWQSSLRSSAAGYHGRHDGDLEEHRRNHSHVDIERSGMELGRCQAERRIHAGIQHARYLLLSLHDSPEHGRHRRRSLKFPRLMPRGLARRQRRPDDVTPPAGIFRVRAVV